MRRTGLAVVTVLVLAGALTALIVGSSSHVDRMAPTSSVARVRPELSAMLRSELSQHPFAMIQAPRHRLSVLQAHRRTRSLLPRSITGWSCPVTSGSPCGAKSRAEFMPLTVNQIESVAVPAPAQVGRGRIPQINISPTP